VSLPAKFSPNPENQTLISTHVIQSVREIDEHDRWRIRSQPRSQINASGDDEFAPSTPSEFLLIGEVPQPSCGFSYTHTKSEDRGHIYATTFTYEERIRSSINLTGSSEREDGAREYKMDEKKTCLPTRSTPARFLQTDSVC
jgi:hypothetical protein